MHLSPSFDACKLAFQHGAWFDIDEILGFLLSDRNLTEDAERVT